MTEHPIRFYNTLSRRLEEFVPIEPDHVRLYPWQNLWKGFVTQGEDPAGHTVVSGRQADLANHFFQPAL